jgi:hypothetical protein
VSDTDYLFGDSSSTLAAAFSYLPTTPLAGLSVRFTDASTGDPGAWVWDFGDGSSSSVQNPSHTFSTPGTYTVSLTVTAAAGSDSATSVVTVTPACTITAVTLTQSPFGLRVRGAGFRSGCKILINGRAAPTTLRRGPTLLLARGSALQARLPKGVAVRIVVRNPNGGRSASFVFTR